MAAVSVFVKIKKKKTNTETAMLSTSAEGFGLGATSGSRQNMVESSRGHVSSSQPHRRGRYRDLTSSSDSNQQQAMLSK